MPVTTFSDPNVRPEIGERGGVFFTPSNTAKQNYMYLQGAGLAESFTGSSTSQPLTESYLMLYSNSGTGELEYLDRRFTIAPNEGFLIDCRQPYSYRCLESSDNWQYMWFIMNGNTFNAYYSQFAAVRKPTFKAAEGSELESFIRHLGNIAFHKDSPQNELLAGTAITNILTTLILKSSEPAVDKRSVPKYIEGIMERINTGYTGHISLDGLAAEFNVSKFHLSREFKKYTGYSPNEYLISVRINRAKELLRRTAYSVGEISQMTGCGDVNHFIQLFKSREKTTPAAYRRHWQEK